MPPSLEDLARAYVAGESVDWDALFADVSSQHVHLPHYPFQRRLYRLPPLIQPHSQTPEVESIRRRIRELRDFLNASEAELARLDGEQSESDQLDTAVQTYIQHWQPYTFTAAPRAGTWLLLDDGSTACGQVRAALSEAGCRVITRTLDDDCSAALQAALDEDIPQGIINGWTLSADPADASGFDLLLRFFRVVQAVAARGLKIPIWTLTGPAHAVNEEDDARLEFASVWGCAHVAAMEHTECWGGLAELGLPLSTEGARRLAALIATPGLHGFFALRQSEIWTPQIMPAPLPDAPLRPASDGAWLITGAFGGLGLLVVRLLMENGVRRFWLTSRGGPKSSEAERLVADLQAAGAEVHVCRADAGSAEQMARVFADLDASGLPLRGVIHAAGISPAIFFDDYREDEIHHVVDAKIRGALMLDAYARRHDVRVFCVFSSVASVFGGLGMAAYAAGNHFMDALMWLRRRDGLPGVSVSWGPWGQVGMFTDDMWSRLKYSGLRPVLPEPGMEALQRILAGDQHHYIAAAGDMSRFLTYCLKFYAGGGSETPTPAAEPLAVAGAANAAQEESLRDDLQAMPKDRRRDHLMDILRTEVARILGLETGDLDPMQGFFNIGMDSLTAVELRNRIKTLLGIALEPTLLFSAPCLSDLTDALLNLLAGENTAAVEEATAPPEPEPADDLQAILAEIDASYKAL